VKPKRRWWRTVRAQLRDLRVLLQEFRRPLALFVAIALAGATLFHVFYVFPESGRSPDPVEALYGTFCLMFFENVLPLPGSGWLRITFFVIPILGIAAVADGVVRFGAALLDKRARAQNWEIAMASTYRHHVIVCGLGRVGYRVTLELLKFGRDVVVVEPDEDNRFIEKARGRGVPVILGDARRTTNLLKAGVERADAIIPCTDDELANLDIALDAREANPGIRVVVRMYDPDMAKRVRAGFGIQTVFSTSALAAPIFATAATGLDIKHSFYGEDVLLSLSELVVEEGAALIGRVVLELEKELDLSVVLLQPSGGASDIHPDKQYRLQTGDRLIALAAAPVLVRLQEMNRRQQTTGT